jgi:hypothetical protein
MGPARTLPLFDERAQPSSWNERMAAGEYAVHYSSFIGAPGTAPSCTIFGSLEEAEAHAREQIAQRPDLRCRIYDHEGFVGPPIREFSGSSYKGESGISARFRRWVGSVLFLGGLILMIVDWTHDFTLTWPATIGTRLLIPGVILLVTEAVFVLHARRKRGTDDGRKSV